LQQIPPHQIAEMQNWFNSVDADRSGTIEAGELAQVQLGGVPLGQGCGERLIRMFDKSSNGKIDFYEYAALHQFLKSMQNAFFQADKDKNGVLDSQEIHHALQLGGFADVSLSAVQTFFKKYDKQRRGINFATFIDMVATMALMRSRFVWADTNRSGYIAINFNQLLEMMADV